MAAVRSKRLYLFSKYMACSGGESVSLADLAEGDSLSQVAALLQPRSDWAAKQEGVKVIAWRTFLIRRRR